MDMIFIGSFLEYYSDNVGSRVLALSPPSFYFSVVFVEGVVPLLDTGVSSR